MSSSLTSPNDDESGPSYEALGFASIEVRTSETGVSLIANADGLRSLAGLFEQLAQKADLAAHIHLTPTMQLVPASAPFVVARKEGGLLPNGSSVPSGEDAESDG